MSQTHVLNRPPHIYRLCVVTDRGLARGRSLLDVTAAALKGGATMVQLREKNATTRAFLEEARALKALLAPLGVPLIINDRVDIALAVDADGVHVGQTDMPVEAVRALVGAEKILGLSITSEAEITRADALAADYLGVGPAYAQTTKADASTPLGVDGFAALCRKAPQPVMAIGGIDATNAAPLAQAGADGVAVVSAIMAANDCEAAAREIIRALDRK
ncbi:MAG: thiamine phosphate synthase [Alphaproteobacteria bacterium]